MTTATISGSAVFNYTAELRPLEAIPGRFHLALCSTFAGAKSLEPRVVFETTLDKDGLLALRNLIDGEVA
jgi:hypothetical protein